MQAGYYKHYQKFRTDYQTKFQAVPYVNPTMQTNWWDHYWGAFITKYTNNMKGPRFKTFWKWCCASKEREGGLSRIYGRACISIALRSIQHYCCISCWWSEALLSWHISAVSDALFKQVNLGSLTWRFLVLRGTCHLIPGNLEKAIKLA